MYDDEYVLHYIWPSFTNNTGERMNILFSQHITYENEDS